MKSNFIRLYFLVLAIIVFDSLKTSVGDNTKSVADENRDDNGDTNDDKDNESLEIPAESNEPPAATPINTTSTVTAACTRRQNSQMHEIKTAMHKQFPFMASVMSQQNKHLCSGTVVSNGLILTTAECTQLAVSYVLLNTTKGEKDETAAALHVIKTEKFPTFTSSSGGKNVGLIYTEKHNTSIAAKLRLSDFTNPRTLVDMEVLGFGLNADTSQTKQLQFIGVENRRAPEFYTDVQDMLYGYIDCIDTKVLTCFKDTGGPSILDNELVGIVVKGDDNCFKEITSVFAVNKKVADILPTYTFKAWLDEKIKKNEEQDLVALATYPNKPVSRRRMTEKLSDNGSAQIHHLITEMLILNLFSFLM